MKKFINILCNISIIAWILFLISAIIFYGKDLRSEFFFRCILGILLPFMVPVFFHFSLINRKDKWKPSIWLIIYLITLCLLLIPAVFVGGFVEYIEDLPLAIHEDYSKISSSLQIINRSTSGWTIEVKGKEFKLPKGMLIDMDSDNECTIIYLPHSKYVIDIIDEKGNHLIK